MIKLDLHIDNRGSVSWKDTMLAAIERRKMLEEQAREHEAQTGAYIRPISSSRSSARQGPARAGFIHSEDVREYLLTAFRHRAWDGGGKDERKGRVERGGRGGRLSSAIARSASSSRSRRCRRWDCSFAYVLAVLHESQLEDRAHAARGPHPAPALRAQDRNRWLTRAILLFPAQGRGHHEGDSHGFRGAEGSAISSPAFRAATEAAESLAKNARCARREIRHGRRRASCCRAFMIRDGREWRPVHYEPDILRLVPWKDVIFQRFFELKLLEQKDKNVSYRKGLDDGVLTEEPGSAHGAAGRRERRRVGLRLRGESSARRDAESVRGNELRGKSSRSCWSVSSAASCAELMCSFLDEMHNHLAKERDRLARDVFSPTARRRRDAFHGRHGEPRTEWLQPSRPERRRFGKRNPAPCATRISNTSSACSAEMPESDFNPFEQSDGDVPGRSATALLLVSQSVSARTSSCKAGGRIAFTPTSSLRRGRVKKKRSRRFSSSRPKESTSPA